MMRGYQCKHKSAEEILRTIGFHQEGVTRGWILCRTGSIKKDSPVRFHALIHVDGEGVEYIDTHVDFEEDGKHYASRGFRVTRMEEIYSDIDHERIAIIGRKMRSHYENIESRMIQYNQDKRYEPTEAEEGDASE